MNFGTETKHLLLDFRDCVLSEDPEHVRWAFDQMRNFSQGFGSYCRDLGQLDALLDQLHQEIVELCRKWIYPLLVRLRTIACLEKP